MRKLTVLAVACALLLGGLGVWAYNRAEAQARPKPKLVKKERHPHIVHALRKLHAARRDLQTAAHDYHGHRVAAIADIDRAIAQLKLALRSDRR
jgi:hypothetical protein